MTGVCQAPPEQAEQDGRNQGVVHATHFREGVAHPTNFLEETRDKTESDTGEKTVGGKNRRDECFHEEKNGQNQDRRNE